MPVMHFDIKEILASPGQELSARVDRVDGQALRSALSYLTSVLGMLILFQKCFYPAPSLLR